MHTCCTSLQPPLIYGACKQPNFTLTFCCAQIYYSRMCLTWPDSKTMIHELEELLSHTKLSTFSYTTLNFSVAACSHSKHFWKQSHANPSNTNFKVSGTLGSLEVTTIPADLHWMKKTKINDAEIRRAWWWWSTTAPHIIRCSCTNTIDILWHYHAKQPVSLSLILNHFL
jgi:hypothetical protein